MPYFSIIIPCLNEEQALPRLLTNLNQQSYSEFEVYVVDGKSTDRTPQIVTQFSAHYPLKLIQTARHNVSFQRNLGAHKARGKVLIFFDADTQIPNNYLEKIHTAFEVKKPHFLTTYIRADSHRAADQLFSSFTNLVFEIGRILKTPSVYGAMMAIKRTTFEDIGGFDVHTSFAEDSQLFQNAMDANYKYLILPTPRYTFSLRRYRAEGTLDTLYQYIRLNMSILVNGYHGEHPQYLMGGHVHQNQHVHQDFVKRFDLLFQKIKTAPKDQALSIKKFFNQLFPEN